MKTLELAPPAMMSPRARAAEITTILARAIVRTIQENQRAETPVRLGFPAGKRVHTTPYAQERL